MAAAAAVVAAAAVKAQPILSTARAAPVVAAGGGGGVTGGGGLRGITTINLASDVSVAARTFFTTLGVDMANPPGKSVFFNDRLGLLFVKATLSGLGHH